MNRALQLSLDLARGYAGLSRRLDGRLGALHGISFADYAILWQLRQAPAGRLRRVDLAERLGLTASAVTRALIPLEKIGLVKREADKYDARVGYASLTRAGERVTKEATESAELVCGEVFDGAGADLATLSGVLARLG